MPDREKAIKGLEGIYRCISPVNHTCGDCPYQDNHVECIRRALSDALELLKQPEDKELHLDDLDALVNMIAIKAKAEGRFFSPYEVGLALVAHGQHDERFKWGEVIKYSPSEVEQILNEVMQNADD